MSIDVRQIDSTHGHCWEHRSQYPAHHLKFWCVDLGFPVWVLLIGRSRSVQSELAISISWSNSKQCRWAGHCYSARLLLFGKLTRLPTSPVVRGSVFALGSNHLANQSGQRAGRPRNTWAAELSKQAHLIILALCFVFIHFVRFVISLVVSFFVGFFVSFRLFCIYFVLYFLVWLFLALVSSFPCLFPFVRPFFLYLLL